MSSIDNIAIPSEHNLIMRFPELSLKTWRPLQWKSAVNSYKNNNWEYHNCDKPLSPWSILKYFLVYFDDPERFKQKKLYVEEFMVWDKFDLSDSLIKRTDALT